MKDHNSGAKDQAEDGGVGGAGANVVPLPRSWYGSVDELVPIDPGPPPGSDRRTSLTGASAFWGGDDERPGGVEAGRSEAGAIDFPNPGDGRPRRGPGGVGAFRREAGGAAGGRWGLPATALALALLALGAVAAIGTLSGRGAPNQVGTRAPTRKPVLTVTQTVPQTTTVVQTVSTDGSELARQRSTERDSHRPPDPDYRKQNGCPQRPATFSRKRLGSVAGGVGSVEQSRERRCHASAGSGSTSSTAGSSKPSCAPSVTNGGACSL